jgi:hypothetical protein
MDECNISRAKRVKATWGEEETVNRDSGVSDMRQGP